MATNIPTSLKVIQPFLKLAKEYENRDPVVAYWSKREGYIYYIRNNLKLSSDIAYHIEFVLYLCTLS